MTRYNYVIVDANTGLILNGKVYAHKGTAELQIRRGGFYLPNIHAPIVVNLTAEILLETIESDSDEYVSWDGVHHIEDGYVADDPRDL